MCYTVLLPLPKGKRSFSIPLRSAPWSLCSPYLLSFSILFNIKTWAIYSLFFFFSYKVFSILMPLYIIP